MYRALTLTATFLTFLFFFGLISVRGQSSTDISDAQYERLRQALLKNEGRLSQRWQTSNFGNFTRCSSNPAVPHSDEKKHQGVDFGKIDDQRPLAGKPVFSPVSGKVLTAAAGEDCTTEKCLSTLAIYNAQANKTYIFLHMTGVERWREGNDVSVGAELGFVGRRGPSSGPHLHYEVRPGKQRRASLCVNATLNPYTSTFADGTTGPPSPGAQRTSWEFNSDNNREAWELHNFSAFSVHGGLLYIDPAGNDFWIESSNLAIDASVYKTVELRLASNARDGNGEIFFRTQAENSYHPDKSIPFTVKHCPPGSGCYGGASFYPYSIHMGGHQKWRGVITGIRIDPANDGVPGTNRDTVAFDFVRLAPTISAATIFEPPPAFGVSADVSPGAPAVNQPASVTTTVTNPSFPDEGLNVRVEVYDSEARQVFSRTFENQSFGAGETRIFSFSWTPAAAGTYRIKAGVWDGTSSEIFSDSLYSKSFHVVAAGGPSPPTSYAIRGRVTDASGNGVAGVDVVFFSFNVRPDDAFTDGAGNFVAQPAFAGVNYVVVPIKQGFYFSPRHLRFNDLRADQTANFVAYPSPSQVPNIMTEPDAQTAVSLESAVMMAGPFAPDSKRNLSADERNRIMLFAADLGAPQDKVFDITDLRVTGETTVDGRTVVFLPEIENFSKVPGQDSLTSIVVKLPEDIYVTGEAWLTFEYLGTTANRVKIKVAPASIRYFYSFEEGGPGTPGDGVTIDAGGGSIPQAFDLSVPLRLGGYAAEGLTVTSFLPPGTQTAPANFSFNIVSNREPGPCQASFGGGGGIVAGQTLWEGATGYYVNVPPSQLNSLVQAANSFNPGCNFTIDDLSIKKIYINLGNGSTVTILDALAISRGTNNFAGSKDL
jgi:murein DD-endopeptidase MepM/ murein hydrolase activator NlpD